MSRKIKTTKTPEQRHAEAEALHASITEQVEQLRNSDTWHRFLDFAQAFHAYSLNNVLLILAQYPTASQVAGFRKWQELGRQVRKGEKAIKIFGIREKKITNSDEPDERDGSELVRRYFPMLSVFDVSQTDLMDPEAGDPASLARQLTGDDPLGVIDAVTDYLTENDWSVDREPLNGRAHGYTAPERRKVVIDCDLSPAQAAKTALHETAHVILHSDQTHAEYVEHRGEKETEAESVAYIVAGLLGLDTSAYSVGYIAHWSDADTEIIKATAANVLRAAHQLSGAISQTAEPGQPGRITGQ